MAFNYKYLVDIYEMAEAGLRDKDMAKRFKVTPMCFSTWKKKLPSVQYALTKGKSRKLNKSKSTQVTWNEYIGTRLSPEVAKIWNTINKLDMSPNGYGKIEEILKDKGKAMRQELFVTALMSNNFNTTTACRKVNIPKKEFDRWLETDPDFIELIDEIEQTKKDFYEEHLVKLVRAGDSPATTLANKTINRDRGYGESVKHEHGGVVGHVNIHIHDLNLPIEVQRIILQAVKEREKALADAEQLKSLPAKMVKSKELVATRK